MTVPLTIQNKADVERLRGIVNISEVTQSSKIVNMYDAHVIVNNENDEALIADFQRVFAAGVATGMTNSKKAS